MMAKPDRERVYVTAQGQVFRDTGLETMAPAFNEIVVVDTAAHAVSSGIPIGGVYALAGGNPTVSGLTWSGAPLVVRLV